MVLCFRVLWKPTSTFRLLRTRSSWAPAATCLVTVQIFLIALPALFTQTPISVSVVVTAGMIVLLWMYVKWILSAVLLHSFVLFLGVNSTSRGFQDALVVNVYSSAVYIFASCISGVVGALRWVVGLTDRFQFVSFVSVRSVLEEVLMTEIVSALLSQVNFFSIWYLSVLTIAVTTVYSLKVRTAILFSGFIWIFVLMIHATTRSFLNAPVVG